MKSRYKHNWISGALLIAAILVSVVFGSSPCLAGSFSDQTSALAPGLDDGVSAAWGDYNNDGYVDLLAGGNLFQNVAGTGGIRQLNSVMTGVDGIWADYDNDGRLDFYHSRLDSVTGGKLYRNTGSGFSTVSFPELPSDVSRGASWADYDNNGFVDLYVGGYEIWGAVPAYYDSVVHNTGSTFTHSNPGDRYNYKPARGVTSCDFDRDGDQDVFVSNYRLEENVLWQNNGSGAFTDVTVSVGADEPTSWQGYGGAHTIGSAWGDLDNDGYMDLFVGNFAHPDNHFGSGIPRQPESQFLRNLGPDAQGDYHFEDKSATAGLHYQESYASPTLGDYDNDGDLDLFFTTVYSGDNPVLYRNDGNWNFTNVTAAEGLAGIGPTYQAAWADYDNDGDLDLVSDGQLFVNDESQTGSNHWLKVRLTGDGVNVNRAAIGAEVRVHTGGGQILTRQVEGGTGEGNQNDLTLHFGLGSHDGPVDLEITSPDGTSRMIYGVAVDDLAVIELTPPDPAAVHYHFDEVAVGQWEVSVEVTGEGTSGLSAYAVWVYADPATVSYTENALFDYATFRGFLPPNLVQGDVGGDFNVGNYQSAGVYGLTGVGMVPISMTDVDLDVPALLGILSTLAGLGEDDFAALSAGLLNATNDGYLTEMIVTYEVNPLDWLLGDANHDGLVGADDYVSIQANFGNSGAAGILGDANFDGLVSADDYASVQANFGNTSGTSGTAVPEPATLVVLGMGGLGYLVRRRRHDRIL